MRTVKATTEPFTCPSCITKIETTVGRLDGVEDVSVLFNAGKVKVTYDEDRIDAGTLAQTVTDLGYPVQRTSRPTAVPA